MSRDPPDAYEFMSTRAGTEWRGRFGDAEVQRSDIVDLALVFHRDSEKGLLLSQNGDPRLAQWGPKSMIDGSERSGIWSMPEWLAKEKGWL